MGAVSWGFRFYFGKGVDARRFEKEFARAIAPHTVDKRAPKRERGSYEGVHLKVPGSEYGGVVYDIGARQPDQLTFMTSMSDGRKEVDLLDDIMLTLAQKLGPVCAISVMEPRNTANENAAMFYRNPYFFLLEPPGAFSDVAIEDFLEDEATLQKISEFKRILPLEELIAVLRLHCKQVFACERGVGILKGDYSPEEACIYPHYFLRQLVRRRGVHLEEGSAEKYAREAGIK